MKVTIDGCDYFGYIVYECLGSLQQGAQLTSNRSVGVRVSGRGSRLRGAAAI